MTQEVEALFAAALEASGVRDHVRAIALCEHALGLQPEHAGALQLLGFWRLQQARWAEAIDLCHAARQAGGDNPELLNNLATAYYRSGDLRRAANALTTALKSDPDHADTHLNLASLLLEVRQPAAARAHAERALAISPRRYESLLGMGLLCRAEDRFGEALRWLAEAESVAPEKDEAPMTAGVLNQEMGLPAVAIAAFERVLRRHPRRADVHSNRLFCMNYLSGWNAEDWLANHRRFEAEVILPRRREAAPKPPDPDRRCRIGYVSADFCNHAVMRFFLPVLRHHDGDRFHLTAYYSGRIVDDTTREIAGLCDAFRPVAALDDEQLLAQIADDAIDVLVDLSGHSSNNRLPVFAVGAAPLQVTWLGYLGSTGLSAMHVRLTDAIADPPGVSESWHTEQLIRLPRSQWAYEPYPTAPPVGASPRQRTGHITFGVLGNPAKISDAALRAWAEIVQRVPGSRLVLMARGDPAVHLRYLQPFDAAGIDRGRLILLSRLSASDYLATYGGIDIALDAFPYSGATTVCDALWQGVPVLAVRSLRPFGGSAATILHQVGLDGWVVDSAAALVDLAVLKASPECRSEVDGLRPMLRGRMQASPLGDAAGFTRHLENALHDRWTGRQ